MVTDLTCQAKEKTTPATFRSTGRDGKDYCLEKNKAQKKHVSNLTKENKTMTEGLLCPYEIITKLHKRYKVTERAQVKKVKGTEGFKGSTGIFFFN